MATIKLIDIINEDLFTQSLKLDKYEKLIVSAVIGFMKDKFGFTAKIIVKKKSNNDLYGDVVLNDNSLKKNKFYLHFNPNQSYVFMIKSLIHELIHVKQISKGELKPSSDYKALLWKGKLVITTREYKKFGRKDFAEYKKLPWEKEAYSNMNKLYKPFLSSVYWQSLKGKDPTLDFIINDLE